MQQYFLGTIGWIKANLMASSQASDKYNNDNFYPGSPDLPSSEPTDAIPLNVPLIPDMTSNTAPSGTCFNAKETAAYTSTSLSYVNANKAWVLFNSAENSQYVGQKYKSEGSTKSAISFGYYWDFNQYKSWLTPGTYRFTTKYGDCTNLGGNLQTTCNILIQLLDDTWEKVASGSGYPQLPYTQNIQFTTTKEFKGIKFLKTNPANYNHTRNYYRYGTQLTKIAHK